MTTLPHVMRDILFWLSAFSIGTSLFAAALCLRMVKANPRRYLAFAGFKIGYSVVVGTVLIRILLPLNEVPADSWAWAYTIGVALAGASAVGVGRTIRIEYVEWEAERDEGTK